MTVSPEIEREFTYAKASGWLMAFQTAGKAHSLDPALLMAIASRETNMRNIVGDRGHGYGLMQIDIGTDPEFCHSGAWRSAILGIHAGASILDNKRTQLLHLENVSLSVGGFRFIGKHIDDADVIRVSVAAYNSGLWAYLAFSGGEDPDKYTTGHNYAADVLQRQAQFAELLK